MRLFAAAAFLFAAPLFAQGPCSFVVPNLSLPVSAAKFDGTINVTQSAGPNCDPRFSTPDPKVNWLHITSGSANVAPKLVAFTVDANTTPNSRIGVMLIANQTVTVTQGAANCSLGIDTKSHGFAVGGGAFSFTVQSTCTWAAFPSAGWIRISAGNQGAPPGGPVNFSVDPDHCVAGRSGSITVGVGVGSPPVFLITQDGSQDNLTLSATSATVTAAAVGDTRIFVTTGDGCGWSAFSDVSWMQITGGSSGTGNGGIVYHLLENKSSARTGSIHVGAATYTVTQQAPAPPPVVLSSVGNAANYATDAVSPGEIVTLFGTNMGPGSIVTLQVSGATVTDNLAGTQVLFDGVAAPMIYSLTGQVSAVVPYGVAGKSSTKVQVQYQGVASNTLTIPVQSATPAIFTLDASGAGPGAILNQDNSLNSSANPAARLSIIAIYLTGGGVTTPGSSDGAVTGAPPPLLAQAPTVTIDGVGAVVKYAGAAPGAVAGLIQINVEVPAAVADGLGLPVIVKIGNFASTSAATVAVK